MYYLLAERMPSHKDPRRLDAYKRGIEIFKRGLICRKEPVEFVEVPYGKHKLPAIFSKAPVPGRAPCMVHFDGLDVTKEIIYAAVADEFRRRGVSLLIVDHPGVGAALRLLGTPERPGYRKAGGRQPSIILKRVPTSIRERIGIMALTLGGYYAPRAAAFEKRFKCAVAWGAIFDYGKCVTDRIGGKGEPSVPGYAEHVNWVFGCDTHRGDAEGRESDDARRRGGQDHLPAAHRARRERPPGAALARRAHV